MQICGLNLVAILGLLAMACIFRYSNKMTAALMFLLVSPTYRRC